MIDIVDEKTRSRMMSRIRGKDTKPEIRLRKALHAKGFRYRLHVADLPGKPDIFFPRYRAALFVHGCFWHRHPGCRYTTSPSQNSVFWQTKFEKTVVRDNRKTYELKLTGYRVGVVWECETRSDSLQKTVQCISDWLTGHAEDFPEHLSGV